MTFGAFVAYLRSRAHIVLKELLIELRENTGLNQVDFAARVGWKKGVIERIESGQQIPTYLEAMDWAKAAGITGYAFTWRYQARLKQRP